MTKEVMTIPATKRIGNMSESKGIKKIRVAAYCRVSTDTEEQATSYQTQIEHYQEVISKNPEWTFAGIFADDGISATSTKNREEFNKMIRECMNGKIDMIITKSISRFARNTVDCLNYIRQLKSQNIPVYFEKESINTMDSRGEVLLTIMASLAQQESESLSQNVKLGMQYRFQQGKIMVNTTCFLGYDKDKDGNLVINPEQAEIVKRIFREYLEGKSILAICRGLERDKIQTSRGNSRWHDSSVRKILENEKYMGDALLQKTYTVDFLKKKRIKNTGEMPQYYVTDDHEAIIPKKLFMMVQEEMARRGSERDCFGKKRGFSSNHCFSQIVYCAECGEPFRRIHWNNRGKKSVVWRCSSRLDKKGACHARTLSEEILKLSFVSALNQLLCNNDEYLKILQENIAEVLQMNNPDSSESIDIRLGKLQKELIDRAERREDYDDIANEIFRLREQKEKSILNDTAKNEYLSRMEELKNFIKNQPSGIIGFDETLVKHLLSNVTVHNDHLEFKFKSGVKVEIKN